MLSRFVLAIKFKYEILANFRDKYIYLVNKLLLFGSKSNNLFMVKFALKFGADINCEDDQMQTPLSLAARFDYSIIAELLLKNKDSINKENSEIYYDLTCKAVYKAILGNSINVLNLLIKNNVRIDLKDDRNSTFLHIAVVKGSDAIVQILIDNKINLNARDIFGYTALHKAVPLGTLNALELLIESGADIKIENTYNNTALSEALIEQKDEAARLLVLKSTRFSFREKRDISRLEPGFRQELENLIYFSKVTSIYKQMLVLSSDSTKFTPFVLKEIYSHHKFSSNIPNEDICRLAYSAKDYHKYKKEISDYNQR